MKIFNGLTSQKEEFVTLKPNEVSIYVCGITVYDYCHIGHARSMLSFDFITRYWRYRGFKVNYVRNITDIDDKIIKRAAENGEEIDALTTRFIQAMDEDADRLNILKPDHEPRATEHISGIIQMIERLISKDHAYLAANGDVYFRVRSFEGYGRLSHKTIDDLQVGARVEPNEAKSDPLDFVLWKAAKEGERCWESPWGKGRPGWHIECSAMSTDIFGPTFDVHGGGLDLKFPHHENEIAQSEAATGHAFVRYWMHAGLVQSNAEKMSKSLGNFFTIREVLDKYPGEVIRYLMISSHYRSPLNYSDEAVHAARAAIERLYNALRGIEIDAGRVVMIPEYEDRFMEAMDDDFNTPEAMVVLFDLAHEINRSRAADMEKAAALAFTLRSLGGVLGLLQDDPALFLQGSVAAGDVFAIEKLIAERDQARSAGEWARADAARDKLTAMGISLEDTARGTIWRRQ